MLSYGNYDIYDTYKLVMYVNMLRVLGVSAFLRKLRGGVREIRILRGRARQVLRRFAEPPNNS
eukprot:4226878-Heterocapsa_arctica.AAC.1